MKNTTQNIMMTSMFAALTCVATIVIKIPSPLNGYINLGDCIVLLSGWLLQPFYGFAAAGLGSALADLFAGYVTYAPITFAIKGIMSLTAYYAYRFLEHRFNKRFSRYISGIAAECVMIVGYFMFEGVLYGFGVSIINIPANGIQGVAGLLLGVMLIKLFEKNKIGL